MKYMSIVFVTFFFLLGTSFAKGPGLSSGANFESQKILGRVNVRCHSAQGSDFATYSCLENILLPREWDHFVHPEKVAGDKVTLVSHQSSGQVRTKTKRYDSETGVSRNFNLWISTLFQRALLDYGLNRIEYEVTKDGIIQDFGSFNVKVKDSDQARQCPLKTYFSSRLSDCRSGGLSICQKYFRDLNYCL